MSEKRRGLGRGLGALIPSSPVVPAKAGDRPVDVFFADRGDDESGSMAPETTNTGLGQDVTTPITGEELTAPFSGESLEPVHVTLTENEVPPSAFTVDTAVTAGGATETGDLDADLEVQWTTDARAGGFGVPLSRESSEPSAINPTIEQVAPSEVSGFASPAPEATVPSGSELVPVPGARFAELPVLSIRPNPRQPRTVFDEEALAELVHSIREIGVLQPVVVRPVTDGSEFGFELIMGERRWRATQEAGLETIPAIIRDTEDDVLLRDALLENLHRSDLNALEEAAAYQQLLDDFGCTHEELATRIGRSRPQISNTIRLLRLPPAVQRRVAAGVLSAGHARALLGLDNADAMDHLAQRIVAEGLSVRATEESVSLSDSSPASTPRRRPRAGGQHAELDDLAARLGDRLDTKVHVALGSSKGRLTIDFASVEDLNRILDILVPQERGVFKAPA